MRIDAQIQDSGIEDASEFAKLKLAEAILSDI
jgi:hypothetical protein